MGGTQHSRCKNYQNLEKKNNRIMEEMKKFSPCIEFISPTLLAFLLQKGGVELRSANGGNARVD